MVSTDIQKISPKMIHHNFIFTVKSIALADLEAPRRAQSFLLHDIFENLVNYSHFMLYCTWRVQTSLWLWSHTHPSSPFYICIDPVLIFSSISFVISR